MHRFAGHAILGVLPFKAERIELGLDSLQFFQVIPALLTLIAIPLILYQIAHSKGVELVEAIGALVVAIGQLVTSGSDVFLAAKELGLTAASSGLAEILSPAGVALSTIMVGFHLYWIREISSVKKDLVRGFSEAHHTEDIQKILLKMEPRIIEKHLRVSIFEGPTKVSDLIKKIAETSPIRLSGHIIERLDRKRNSHRLMVVAGCVALLGVGLLCLHLTPLAPIGWAFLFGAGLAGLVKLYLDIRANRQFREALDRLAHPQVIELPPTAPLVEADG